MKNLTPKWYGIIYFFLIPIFAGIYYFLPSDDFKTELCMDNYLTCVYFSTVTITTLGYGDISAISNLSQILVGLETISGIILIGLFLNSLSHQKSKEISEEEKRKSEKEAKKQDFLKILRHNKLIEKDIETYKYYAYQVTTPMSKRITSKELNRQFILNDLQDLYKSSLSMTDNISEPLIKHFYVHQDNLKHSIRDLLLNVNFFQLKDLESECFNLLTSFKTYDYSSSILSPPNIAGQDTIDHLSNNIKNSTLDPDVAFERGNLMNPYIALYRLIKITLAFTDFYNTKIGEIKKEIEDEI